MKNEISTVVIHLYDWLSVLFFGSFLLLLRWEDGRAAVVLHLPLELVSARLDRHPGAVKAERVHALLAPQPLVTHGKVALKQKTSQFKMRPIHDAYRVIVPFLHNMLMSSEGILQALQRNSPS